MISKKKIWKKLSSKWSELVKFSSILENQDKIMCLRKLVCLLDETNIFILKNVSLFWVTWSSLGYNAAIVPEH